MAADKATALAYEAELAMQKAVAAAAEAKALADEEAAAEATRAAAEAAEREKGARRAAAAALDTPAAGARRALELAAARLAKLGNHDADDADAVNRRHGVDDDGGRDARGGRADPRREDRARIGTSPRER